MKIVAQGPAGASLADAAQEALQRRYPFGVAIKRWRFQSPTGGAPVEAILLAEGGGLVVVFSSTRTGEFLGRQRFVRSRHGL